MIMDNLKSTKTIQITITLTYLLTSTIYVVCETVYKKNHMVPWKMLGESFKVPKKRPNVQCANKFTRTVCEKCAEIHEAHTCMPDSKC